MPDTSRAVLITGCSTGIGRATAIRLASKGHTVYATARRIESIADLADAGCRTLALDVCDEQSVRDAVAKVEAECGAVGVLVNNAGYGEYGAIEDIPMSDVRKQFETNVFGPILLTKVVLPGMRRQRWGRIINVSSMGGKVVFPGGGLYHGTKWALEAISDALRFELAGFGIDVAVIEPGIISTQFGDTSVDTISRDDAPPESPYADFNAAVAKRNAAAYEGSSGAPPESVAKVIEHAITSKRPRTRYPVTAAARAVLVLRRVLPDRAWDRFMRTQYPPPKPKA